MQALQSSHYAAAGAAPPIRWLSGVKMDRTRRITAFAWKQVIDPVTKKPYFWNTQTNETRWSLAPPPEEDTSGELSNEELTELLLGADTDTFGDTANKYRPRCFELDYFEYLTARISAASDPHSRLALERLRARLSNPLLKNPPPYA